MWVKQEIDHSTATWTDIVLFALSSGAKGGLKRAVAAGVASWDHTLVFRLSQEVLSWDVFTSAFHEFSVELREFGSCSSFHWAFCCRMVHSNLNLVPEAVVLVEASGHAAYRYVLWRLHFCDVRCCHLHVYIYHLQRISELGEFVWNRFENVWNVSKGFELFCKGFTLSLWFCVGRCRVCAFCSSLGRWPLNPKSFWVFLPNDVQGRLKGPKWFCWNLRWRLMGGKPT